MKTTTQYEEDVKAINRKIADIDAQCINENREPTESELALKNELMDAAEDTMKIIATARRQERITAALEKPDKPITRPGPQSESSRIEVREKDRFKSLGEQLAAVTRAGSPGGHVDPRLLNAASGLGESVSSDGGLRAFA